MIIWFAALIPFIGAGALYWIFHHKVMNWNWEVVQGHLLVFGSPILGGILATWVLAKLVGRLKPKKVNQEETLKKTFLEEALEADADRPRPNKAYTWDDFQKDLHDGSMTFNEIYEKYGGVFPKKPEAPKEGETKAEKKEEGPGARSDDPDRMAQLTAWFQERGKEVPLKGLVRPPPAPHTIIQKVYIRGRR